MPESITDTKTAIFYFYLIISAAFSTVLPQKRKLVNIPRLLIKISRINAIINPFIKNKIKPRILLAILF